MEMKERVKKAVEKANGKEEEYVQAQVNELVDYITSCKRDIASYIKQKEDQIATYVKQIKQIEEKKDIITIDDVK